MIWKPKNNKLAEVKRSYQPKVQQSNLSRTSWILVINKLLCRQMKICLWTAFLLRFSSVSMWGINSMKFLILKRRRLNNLMQFIKIYLQQRDSKNLIIFSTWKPKTVTKQNKHLYSARRVASSAIFQQRVKKNFHRLTHELRMLSINNSYPRRIWMKL